MATTPDTSVAAPLEIVEPLRLAHHRPQSDGESCALCGRRLNSWLRMGQDRRTRLIRLSQEAMTFADGTTAAVCRPCKLFAGNVTFADIDQAVEFVAPLWRTAKPDVTYATVARYGDHK